jgi:hypothetical protein
VEIKFISAGSCKFSVVNVIQASMQEASSNVNVSFLVSGGGGSVVSHFEKNIKTRRKKTGESLGMFICDSIIITPVSDLEEFPFN